MLACSLVTTLLLAQAATPASPAPAATPAPQAHEREARSPSAPASAAKAAEAAARAAEAAQAAAEAAEKTAAAVEKLAATLTPQLSTPAAAVTKPEAKGWAGSLNLGLIWLTGNAKTLTLSGAAAFAKTFHSGWILSFKANGSYGEAAPAGNPSAAMAVTALAASGQLRGDRVLSPLLTTYLLGGLDTDHVASIELRSYAEAGVGLLFLDRKQGTLQTLLLRTDVGIRYADQRQFQYFPTPLGLPDLEQLSPRVGIAFRYAPVKDFVFSEQAEVIPNVLNPNPVLVNDTTQLTAHLVKSLSLAVSFVLAYNSQPPPGKLPTDTALNLSAELAF